VVIGAANTDNAKHTESSNNNYHSDPAMKKIFLLTTKAITGIILIGAIAAIVIYNRWNPSPPDEQAFVNGKILTLDANNSIAQAVYIKGDKIIAVGTDAEIKALIQNHDSVIDLEGKTMMPGIIDAHGHFPGSGLAAVAVNLNSPPIGKITTIADALAELKQKASTYSKGSWMYAYGFDDTQVKEQRFLSREELDSVSTDINIYVQHVSGHMGIANSSAFAAVGIDKNSKSPAGGHIALDSDGELSGLVEETAQTVLVQKALDLNTQSFYKMSSYASDEYLQLGVTTAQSGLTNPKMLNGLSSFAKMGLFAPRLVVWPDLESAELINSGKLNKEELESDRFSIGALKLIADGSIQGYTGFLGHPYHVIPEGKETTYRGYPTLSQQQLSDAVEKFHKAGWQIAMHGNGDAAIDAIIKAFENAQSKHPRADARPIIIHAQMTRDDQLDKFAELNMSPSFFNSHVYYWGDRHKKLFMGPDRANRMSPMNGALSRGIPFTLHLDTPVVPMTPFLAAWSAVTRETSGGDVLGIEQAISAEQALRAITIDAAWQVFEEKTRGSIEAGKLADLIVLDRDPLANSDALRSTKVLRTIIGGVNRYVAE